MAARASWGLEPQAFVVLFVGKLEPKKRPLDLIRAMAGLGSRASVLVVGTGELMTACRSEADRLGLRAAWAGFLNQSELGRAYAVADCLVLPSDGDVGPGRQRGPGDRIALRRRRPGGLRAGPGDARGDRRDLPHRECGRARRGPRAHPSGGRARSRLRASPAESGRHPTRSTGRPLVSWRHVAPWPDRAPSPGRAVPPEADETGMVRSPDMETPPVQGLAPASSALATHRASVPGLLHRPRDRLRGRVDPGGGLDPRRRDLAAVGGVAVDPHRRRAAGPGHGVHLPVGPGHRRDLVPDAHRHPASRRRPQRLPADGLDRARVSGGSPDGPEARNDSHSTAARDGTDPDRPSGGAHWSRPIWRRSS